MAVVARESDRVERFLEQAGFIGGQGGQEAPFRFITSAGGCLKGGAAGPSPELGHILTLSGSAGL
jgi:hypothetical protein